MTKYFLIECALFFFLSLATIHSVYAQVNNSQTYIVDDDLRTFEDTAEIIAVIAAASTAAGLVISIRSDAELLKWYENKKKGRRK